MNSDEQRMVKGRSCGSGSGPSYLFNGDQNRAFHFNVDPDPDPDPVLH
jgi:hypothetical protein